jgi:hypothetical protein
MSEQYIITLNEDATDDQYYKVKTEIQKYGTITSEYSLIKGFGCKITQEGANILSQIDNVKSIEKD